MKKIVIFGGTTEGRLLTEALAGKKAEITVFVATEYGRETQETVPGIRVHSGRLDASEMERALSGTDLCVDATHPYAKEVSANIKKACKRAGILYRRLLRERSELPGNAVTAEDAKAASAFLSDKPGNVLLTTGSKELSAFSEIEKERLFVRVLPLRESLELCEKAQIPHGNILAVQGPFSRELNVALLHQFNIRYLVTKDGGKAGGFGEKVKAAEETGTILVVIRRPEETGETYDAVLKECEEMLK